MRMVIHKSVGWKEIGELVAGGNPSIKSIVVEASQMVMMCFIMTVIGVSTWSRAVLMVIDINENMHQIRQDMKYLI